MSSNKCDTKLYFLDTQCETNVSYLKTKNKIFEANKCIHGHLMYNSHHKSSPYITSVQMFPVHFIKTNGLLSGFKYL